MPASARFDETQIDPAEPRHGAEKALEDRIVRVVAARA
jgi:hypothetical protein